MPTRLTLKKLWALGYPFYAQCPVEVQTQQQRWTAKLSQCKQLVRLRRTVQLFCNFQFFLQWFEVFYSKCSSVQFILYLKAPFFKKVLDAALSLWSLHSRSECFSQSKLFESQLADQGWISPYKYLVPCLSVRCIITK